MVVLILLRHQEFQVSRKYPYNRKQSDRKHMTSFKPSRTHNYRTIGKRTVNLEVKRSNSTSAMKPPYTTDFTKSICHGQASTSSLRSRCYLQGRSAPGITYGTCAWLLYDSLQASCFGTLHVCMSFVSLEDTHASVHHLILRDFYSRVRQNHKEPTDSRCQSGSE